MNLRDHSQPCEHGTDDDPEWLFGHQATFNDWCPGGREVTGLPIAWCYTHNAVRDHHVETEQCDVPRSLLLVAEYTDDVAAGAREPAEEI